MPRPHYFSGKVSSGFVSIYSSRTMLNIASALLGLFLPIFLYELFDLDLKYVLFYYFLDYMLYGFVVPAGARLAVNYFGLKKSMIISSIWGALHYTAFFFVSDLASGGTIFSHHEIWPLLLSAIFLINFQRFLYWVPVHTELSQFTDKSNRVREISFMEASSIALNAIIPVFAGWLLTFYGYGVLFIISILVYLLSATTLLSLPKIEEKFSWTYRQTWKEFFSKKRRRTIVAFMGDGAENVVSSVIWPIFIWTLLSGDYFKVGAISSLIVLSTVVLQLAVGRLADLGKKEKIFRLGTILYSLVWVIKMFIDTAFQIFVVSTLHNFTRLFTRTTFDAMIYEKAADQGHYVDEYTVIHEMAITFGRVLMIIIVFLLVPVFGLSSMFILAATATLLMNFLIDKNEVIDRRGKLVL